jgi:ribosomal protein S11
MRYSRIRWWYRYGFLTKKTKRNLKVFLFKINIKKKVKKKFKFKIFLNKKTKLIKKSKWRFLKYKVGIIRVSANRRNIFATLSNSRGRLLVTVTTGILLAKGKERQATHIIRATANLLTKKIKKEKLNKVFYIIRGNSTRRKKKLFYDTISRTKHLKIKKIIVSVPRAHNGCRPSKKRRL